MSQHTAAYLSALAWTLLAAGVWLIVGVLYWLLLVRYAPRFRLLTPRGRRRQVIESRVREIADDGREEAA